MIRRLTRRGSSEVNCSTLCRLCTRIENTVRKKWSLLKAAAKFWKESGDRGVELQ